MPRVGCAAGGSVHAESQDSGLAASTLRYYEAQGLISAAGRDGLRRQNQPQARQQLALITLGRIAGFSLAEIGRMLRSARPAIIWNAQNFSKCSRPIRALG